jgi:hypothetical protein
VLFSEASGSPQAIKVWFYPGNRIGNEFVYPKSQAMRIAKETHQSVLATNDDSTNTSAAGEIPAAMKSAELGRFDENGVWQGDNKTVAVNGNSSNAAPAIADRTASAEPARTATADTATRPTGTAGARAPRKSLPRTAGSMALFELISGLSLAGGLGLRLRRC